MPVKTAEELRRALRGLDRRGYPAYKSLAGAYRFADFCLFIDHVQGDPFAAPSSLRVEVPYAAAGFPEKFRRGRAARTALADFLTRQMAAQFERCTFKAKGSGKSGLMSITRCGQEVLERSACEISGGVEDAGGGRAGGDVRGARDARGAGGVITVRFHVGFPAFGRTINAGELERILFDFLPVCVKRALFHGSLDARQVEAAVHLAEDQEALRARLREEGLVAFVANGAILPRRSGVSDKPLAGAVPFASPVELERSFDLPHAGRIAGMAVPRGITLIVVWALCMLIGWSVKMTTGIGRLINYVSPTVALPAIIMVVLFARLKPNPKFVQALSPLAFGVYLFQLNPVVWAQLLGAFAFVAAMPPLTGVLCALGLALGIFLAGLAVEFLRSHLAKLLHISRLSQLIADKASRGVDKLLFLLK